MGSIIEDQLKNICFDLIEHLTETEGAFAGAVFNDDTELHCQDGYVQKIDFRKGRIEQTSINEIELIVWINQRLNVASMLNQVQLRILNQAVSKLETEVRQLNFLGKLLAPKTFKPVEVPSIRLETLKPVIETMRPQDNGYRKRFDAILGEIQWAGIYRNQMSGWITVRHLTKIDTRMLVEDFKNTAEAIARSM